MHLFNGMLPLIGPALALTHVMPRRATARGASSICTGGSRSYTGAQENPPRCRGRGAGQGSASGRPQVSGPCSSCGSKANKVKWAPCFPPLSPPPSRPAPPPPSNSDKHETRFSDTMQICAAVTVTVMHYTPRSGQSSTPVLGLID